MKNVIKKCLPILLVLFSLRIAAQSTSTFQTITQNGIFDRVIDRYGNECPLINLLLTAERPGSSSSYSASTIPTNTCSAGYFDLYFATGSYFDLTPAAAAVICQVFTDISSFISSPLSVGSNTVNRIKIYCANNGASAPPGALAAASGFYLMPLNPINPNAGIVDNQIQKALISGQNPFANLPIGVFPGSSNFYSGYVYINPTASWHLNTTVATINSADYDLYSVMLHEVTHALGFHSFLYIVNQSLAGVGNNYFTRYDQYLTNSAGAPLLAGPSPACSNSSLTLQGPTSAISPSYCVAGGTDASTCAIAARYISPNVNVAVYTPFCYEIGSSMSHFEDMCSVPASFSSVATCSVSPPGIYNNLYYVMSNANGTGNCYVKRQLKPEERYVLCDLGYSVNTTYTSSAVSPTISSGYTVTTGVAGSTVNYGGSACQGSNIWGMHDGISGNLFTYTTSTAVFTVLTSALLSNDAVSATSVTCVEVIYNNAATVTVSGGTLTVNSPAPGGIGLVVLKYIPKNSAGQPGNPTYIYVYFMFGSCSISNCNMVQNGDFETVAPNSPAGCGQISQAQTPGVTDAILSCWIDEAGTPDLFTRNCIGPGMNWYNLGNSTYSTVPPFGSHNGAPNNRVLGLGGGERMKTILNAPLIPGNSYLFSAWLYPLGYDPMVSGNTNSIVVTVAADVSVLNINGGAYPFSLPIIGHYTVAPQVWTQVTNTFVFNPANSVNHNVLYLGLNYALSLPFTGGQSYYCLFDDISLLPLSGAAATFSIPQAANCGNTTFTNLAQYANYPGVFSGPGVTSSTAGTLTTYAFNTATPSLPTGTYAIAFTYTDNSGCVNSISQNVILGTANFFINATSTQIYCTNLPPPQPPITLSASASPSAGVSFNWIPGNLSGPSVTVIPTGNQVYTVEALGNCLVTQTVLAVASNSCCTSTITPLAFPIPGDAILTGPYVVNSDIIINSGDLTFNGGEFIFAPNVQIIMNNGSDLHIFDSHLYSCGAMWKGIKINSPGSIEIGTNSYDNLIEDAITAIDIPNHTANNSISILTVTNTTFNKNYIDINISNYQRNTANYPFKINNCVFTCRNLPFTSNTWPQTAATTTAELRYAAPNATLGLAPPYALANATITNLKSPYSSQSSKTAIQLTNVGLTGSTTYSGIAIGSSTGGASDFNLFDAHGFFIDAINSNVTSVNNVFQNTRLFTVFNPPFFFGSTDGGAAIRHSVNNNMNTKLDLTATSPNLGNRFWDCHKGLYNTNTSQFNMEYAIFRSTQSNTLLPNFINGMLPGTNGVTLNTNRLNCFIKNNEFTNLNTGIEVNLTAGTFTLNSPSVQNGIYAKRLFIGDNLFSPLGPNATSTVIGTNYMNQAIDVSCVNAFSWTVEPDLSVPPSLGLLIVGNNIERVYSGVHLNGVYGGFRSLVQSNLISLEEDNIYTLPQFGIAVEVTTGMNTVSDNTLTATGTTPANIQQSLVYCANNSGITSPQIVCNYLQDGYKGVEFKSNNPIAFWAGNEMTNLARGLVLSNGGVIGMQGNNTSAVNNKWLGAAWSGTNYGTYIGANSSATASPIWVKSSSTPPNNNGFVTFQNWFDPLNANGTLPTSSGGDYNCGNFPNSIIVPIPSGPDYATDEHFYIAQTSLYRLLWAKDSILNSATAYSTFYSSFSGSSIDIFLQAEQALYENDHATALSLLGSVSPTNNVEANYVAFYTIYANYSGNGAINASDSTDLYNLTQLCPANEGACIQQARVLYNILYKLPQRYPESCNEDNARIASISTAKKGWKVDLFPNPAASQVNLVSSRDKEVLSIEIMDLSGRLILKKEVKVIDFIATLDLSLLNGAYLITVSNSSHESFNKKLLIAK